MAILWTPEKISQLTLEELKRLAENAKAKGNEEVSSLCQSEIQARKPKPKASISLPDGFIKATRSAIAKNLERNVVDLLVQLANRLNEKFDLSREKARALSPDTKRFIPHRLTDAKGSAKVGGAQKSGLVVFDRYISYRLGDQIYALLVLLREGDEVSSVQYQVAGPADILSNARPISELRPYLPEGASIGLTDFVEEFDNFDEASERFMFLMEQVAPKH
jgi:hypothetical protein